jgi:hypothetical protein
LYCFQETENGDINASELARRVNVGDIVASELFIGGPIFENDEISALKNVNLFPGIKSAAEAFVTVVKEKLDLKEN